MACVLLLLLIAMPSGLAQTQYELSARDEGPPDARGKRPFWFQYEQEQNPLLLMPAGERIEVTVHNRGTVNHTFHVGPPINLHTGIIEPGETAGLSFDVPADATGADYYWCDLHDVVNMGGIASYDGTADTDRVMFEMDRPGLIPGPTMALGLFAVILGFGLAARRRGRGP